MKKTFDKSYVPEPVFESQPELVDFYYHAWELAWNNVKHYSGVPVSPLMKEGFANDRLWIWDTCLMAHFCKYAPEHFPGIESLDNFYLAMHDGYETSLKIHHPDNPPLFAWTEYEYYQLTGDMDRLKRILLDKKYLQKHFDFMENLSHCSVFPYGVMHSKFTKKPYGYLWSGNPSGMDNTPRGFDNYDNMFWLDALAQQALSALYIAKIAKILKNVEIEEKYLIIYQKLKFLMNRYYWCEADGIYYDLRVRNKDFIKVLTPASFWPMLAELPSPEQAEKMSKVLSDPELLGGMVPCPSVARNDPAFSKSGSYWRGGLWVPTTYMTVKSLDKYGLNELAFTVAKQTIEHMYKTYTDFKPATIWECYSPTEPKPSDDKNGNLVRPDFCGWSALAPVSLLVEDVIGIKVCAETNTITWRSIHKFPHGIKRLKMRSNLISLLKSDSDVQVECTEPFTLKLNGRKYSCAQGVTKLSELEK